MSGTRHVDAIGTVIEQTFPARGMRGTPTATPSPAKRDSSRQRERG